MKNELTISEEEYKDLILHYERQIFNLRQLLELAKSFSSVLEYTTLVESLLYICLTQMHVVSAGIFRLEKGGSMSMVFSLENNFVGFDLKPNKAYQFYFDDPILQCLYKDCRPFSIEELIRRVKVSEGLDLMKSLGVSVVVPVAYQRKIGGLLVLGERLDETEDAFSVEDLQQLSDISILAGICINNTDLINQASTDTLTGLKQRHFFYSLLELKLSHPAETDEFVAIMMIDIDFFKRFNDVYGHACGDFVLQRIAHLIKAGIREGDLAARYGGEEFVVMLTNVDEENVRKIAERIRDMVEKDDIVYDGLHMQCTISIGYTVLNLNAIKSSRYSASPAALVDKADKAMYESKRNGRNRVTGSLFKKNTSKSLESK